MGEARNVGITQHQADVGVGDQTPERIDDVGLPALTDLDLRDHVPDELEIDLGDAHAGIAALAGHREGHVRLGLMAEIDRAVVVLVGHGFDEFRILGQVDLAVHDIQGNPRDTHALAARRVDLRDLGDRRDLAQQARRIDPPLFQGARGPGQLRRPAELSLGLFDELTDLGSRSLRLLVLNADQRGLLFLIG